MRRDRAVIGAALVLLTTLAWAYVLWLAHDMEMGGMDMTGFRVIPSGMGLMMPAVAPWRPVEFAFVFGMWSIMMVGMMTPSVAPMVLLYGRIGRQATVHGKPFAAVGWFMGGYLLSWAGFAVVATFGQWMLERAELLTPMMETTNEVFGGAVLIAAGLYQWSPLKNACLRQCQMPWSFIQRNGGFRSDAWGSTNLGAKHGAYCVGCCWTLMAVLFISGVMNVLWVAAISVLVLAEKILPAGRIVSRISGVGFIATGTLMMTSAR